MTTSQHGHVGVSEGPHVLVLAMRDDSRHVSVWVWWDEAQYRTAELGFAR
jgi:hypothetical protein